MVEILTVTSIMVLMVALAVPAMNSLGNASRLSAAGRLVSNLVTIARSEAINQRTLVQLRIVTTNQSGTDDITAHYRKLSLWKLDQTQSPPVYVQFSNWETLPYGVMLESGTSPSYPTQTSNPNPTGNPYAVPSTTTGTYYFLNSTSLGNADNPDTFVKVVSGNYDFAYVQFSPNGGTVFSNSASMPSTVYLMVTEGFLPSSSATTPTYTRKHADWVQVSVNCLTGMSKVIRP